MAKRAASFGLGGKGAGEELCRRQKCWLWWGEAAAFPPSLGGIMSLLITDQPPDQKFILEAISACLIEFK